MASKPVKHMNPGSTSDQPSAQTGGFPCPVCKHLIRFPFELLLSQPSISCPQCGLELQLDLERSSAALQELRKYSAGMEDAQRILDDGQPGGQ
jgi:transcription elongation factor Elf1